MKKLIIAIFLTMAFSQAHGMEESSNYSKFKTQKSRIQLTRNNIIKGLAGLAGAAICGFLTVQSIISDSKYYKKARTAAISKVTTINTASGKFTNEAIKCKHQITIPKSIVAIFPAIAMYLLGKYGLSQFYPIDKPKPVQS